MTELRVFYCLFLLTFLDSTSQIRPSLPGHNNAFVQDDNDVQYLLENIPIRVHKDFTSSAHGAGDSASDEDKAQDSLSHIHFEPHVLDFKERQLGIPHQETVILFNRDHNRTIHLSSISGNTRHFHSSFFQDKVIPPLGNTTFNVVFLGREEGDIDTHLFIHTSDGTLKYQVKGISVSSPYRLRPVVDVKLPKNASFTPLIYMHNPHPEGLQVMEVYSSGGEFQLELPSGEAEGSRELWEIPPYQTKPIIRLHFNAYTEKNHTAYVRFKVNNTAEILVIAVEVEVRSGAGLHWGGSSGVINLGMGGSLQPPIRYPIALKNSAKKPLKVVNIISTPVSKALKLHFEPAVIPGETEIPIAIGTLIYDWKTGLDLQHFKGKLMIKATGPGGSSQKLAIPWIAQVLQGGLEVSYNTSITHYCSPQPNQARNFSVVNKFKLPLAITNVTMTTNVKSLFTIKNFIPRVIKPEQKVNIFSLQLTKERKSDSVKMESSILIHSNVSVTEVPLLSYDGKVRKIMPGEREGDKGTMNFGTVGSGTENEAIFALENQNPVNVELHGWGVNMPGAVLELMGCQRGPPDFIDKEFRNITVCSHSGNQYIKPGYLAIFKIKVKTSVVEEDTIVGDVFVRTTYERFTLPVYMRVAHGRISLKKLVFTDCFPGSICVQQVKVHSTFSRPMEVTRIAPVNKDERIKYIPLEEATMPVISKGENYVGSVRIDPSVTCKQHCYLGLSLDTYAGNQWLNTMSLPSHTRDFDLNLLNARYTRFLNSTGGGSWDNITMRMDTTEVRGHKFSVNIKPYWPSLISASGGIKNRSILMFPLTQVGNTSYKTIKLHNPSMNPVVIQLVMDWTYPQGARLYHSLPTKFKPVYNDSPATVPEEFKLEESIVERDWFDRQWDVNIPAQSFPLYLNPSESKMIRVSYSPSSASLSSALLYIRNNITILEVLRVMGRGANAQFRFGNRKPGSATPLLFELAEKHLKDCERDRLKRNPVPNLTVKRSFTARNTGELPIDVYGFYISGLNCEGYGFKVLNCVPFKLTPNATKKIEIAFTPDFTLTRIERKLLILTSLGSDGSENENGMVRLNLLATLPTHSLESCAAALIRPSWERAVQWAAISLSSILLICVLAVSFLEADRVLRGALANLSRENPVQPPLDLRLLSHVSMQSIQITSKEKLIADEKPKVVKKEETSPDWTLMNVKKCKDKEVQKGLKIPDWSADEERRFRSDTESKDLLSFKKCEDSPLEHASGMNNASLGSKKKNGKKASQEIQTVTTTCSSELSFTDSQERKGPNTSTKSSPVAARKGKTVSQLSKEEPKLVDHEVQVDTTEFLNNGRNHKSDNKRKQSNNGSNNGQNNHVAFKKFESGGNQKSVQFSEEETSSTTTESSVPEDTAPCKVYEQSCAKPEKLQRKPVAKKTKPQAIPAVPCVDYKDNYEGDCDDDEYDKERHNNPNRWKTSTTRSGTKHHMHVSRTVESSYKVPRQNKNPPRKEKTCQKRRVADKSYSKTAVPLSSGISQKEDLSRTLGTISSNPLPPPPSYWGENRAKFSDVVARSQDSISLFSNLNKNQILHKTQASHNLSVFNAEVKQMDFAKHKTSNQELVGQATKEYQLSNSPPTICSQALDTEKILGQDPLVVRTCSSQQSNSYFINTFTEPPFERELVPYDDLPETDEPLVELESPEEDTRCQLWEDNGPMINLLSDSTNSFQLEPPKPQEKVGNLTDTLRGTLTKLGNLYSMAPCDSTIIADNWATVETNWEPLYTRAAVGEERSGVWGVNTGGVWAAAPWGAAAPPSVPQLSTLQCEPDSQERSGFDPFRSLSTIWTPSSTESWKKKHED